MKSFVTLALLSLYTAYALASPIARPGEDDGDCEMEWLTVFGDAPTSQTSSMAAPNESAAPLKDTVKPIMRHSHVNFFHNAGAPTTAAPSEASVPLVVVPSASDSGNAVSSPAAFSPNTHASSAASSAIESAESSAASSAAPSTGSSGSLTPSGKKAGISGFSGVTSKADFSKFTSKISWYSDYSPNPADSGPVKGIGMLWGDGHTGSQDSDRLSTFKAVATASPAPEYMMGFYEPDWTPPDSSAIDPASAASLWSTTLAPLGAKGTKLGSPSLAKQMDETWLTPFENASPKPSWDFTCIHTNKNSSQGVKDDVAYYFDKYKKPVWVAEFSCMNDLSWTACDDPAAFITEVVAYFEAEPNVVAYGYSNGDGLPESWKLFDVSGVLTAAGQTYLSALGA